MNSGPVGDRALIHRQRERETSRRPRKLFSDSEIDEVRQRALLERVLRVEAQAPDVARDDEQVDLAGLVRLDRDDATTELYSGSCSRRALSSIALLDPRPRPAPIVSSSRIALSLRRDVEEVEELRASSSRRTRPRCRR